MDVHGQPLVPGDGRFPDDPEFNVGGLDLDEALGAVRSMARLQAGYRDALVAEGFSEQEVMTMLVTALGAQFGGGK